ncbi:hypothetical protein VN12_14660 [Pirellula sp. SH-Sr6A]|nr:hypothetical protein VN12_14660 [Pirellula sp. SH-Sr6A]
MIPLLNINGVWLSTSTNCGRFIRNRLTVAIPISVNQPNDTIGFVAIAGWTCTAKRRKVSKFSGLRPRGFVSKVKTKHSVETAIRDILGDRLFFSEERSQVLVYEHTNLPEHPLPPDRASHVVPSRRFSD